MKVNLSYKEITATHSSALLYIQIYVWFFNFNDSSESSFIYLSVLLLLLLSFLHFYFFYTKWFKINSDTQHDMYVANRAIVRNIIPLYTFTEIRRIWLVLKQRIHENKRQIIISTPFSSFYLHLIKFFLFYFDIAPWNTFTFVFN